jgi:hypothetical protein
MTHLYAAVLLLLACIDPVRESGNPIPAFNSTMRSVKQIPLPEGFERIFVPENSFAAFLQNLPLRKDKTVYLYNKQPKADQTLHYAVIDISTGDKDLQQCADAIMRLRGEYFFAKKLYDSIRFLKSDRSFYLFSRYLKPGLQNDREQFMQFMQTVFMNCGTYNLEQQLKPVADFTTMQPGDVLIKAGAPGHAEIVVDMALNKQSGKKIFLLAEGYMPAQDIHILLNPLRSTLGPWHEIIDDQADRQIITASWIFSKKQLRHW